MESYTHVELHKTYGFLHEYILQKVSDNLHNGVPEQEVREWVIRTVGKLEPRPEKQAFLAHCLGWVGVVVSTMTPAVAPEQLKLTPEGKS